MIFIANVLYEYSMDNLLAIAEGIIKGGIIDEK